MKSRWSHFITILLLCVCPACHCTSVDLAVLPRPVDSRDYQLMASIKQHRAPHIWLGHVVPMHIVLYCCIVLPALGQQVGSPAPSPAPPTSSWQGTISTGYLAVVFGLAFILVSFTFCTSYCIRVWFLRRLGPRAVDEFTQDAEHQAAPELPLPPPGPPPVIVIQPDRELSCASLADERLQEELVQKWSMASRDDSRFVEVMLDQDENGEFHVKQGALPLSTTAQATSTDTPPRGWLSRAWGACFCRRPRDDNGRTVLEDFLELGLVMDNPSSATRASGRHTGRQRSALQQETVVEEEPAPLQVQGSGPSVSELRRETESAEAVLVAARSVGDGPRSGETGVDDAMGGVGSMDNGVGTTPRAPP